MADAKRSAARVREQTKRSVAGGVERADAASAEMVGHAEALSRGLLQLGELLTEHGKRILRDVQTARREMRAQLEEAVGGEPLAELDAPVPLRRGARRSRGAGR